MEEKSEKKMEKKLGLIGYGNMGSAIASAILDAKALEPEEMAVYEISPRARKKAMQDEILVVDDLKDLCQMCSILLLAVKPDKAASVLQTAGFALEGKALMSIAAGVSSRKLKEFAGTFFLRVLRIMPNTPAMVGAGCMVLCRDTDFTQAEKEEAERLMSAVGIVEWIEEKHLDAVTGLSGSGPAYVAMFIEALADGGVACGLPRMESTLLAAKMLKGSAALTLESGSTPGELKDQVCSPGGSTIQGVRTLEKCGFRGAVMDAVIAAFDKTLDMKK